MYQVLQNYKDGKLELANIPVPKCNNNTLLIKNVNSLISIGTEKSIIELRKKNLIGKAKSRPDLVKRFVEKAKKEGFIKTYKEAIGRLDNLTPLGYSSAGLVLEIGTNITKFNPGDKVACIGAGYASHAEYITIPENLCCKIPEGVNFEEASFGMLGTIALHGIRCAKLTFGNNVAVIGLGLLGMLTIQLLEAYGCKVIGYDIDEKKVNLASKFINNRVTADSFELKNLINTFTKNYGVDAVIITASTKSDKPINLALDIARIKARIVMVGVGDIHPSRNEMWHKEVEILVSKAGGPGVFDPYYENKGIDYPIEYVRWTEKRNLEEFLRLLKEKKVDVSSLITQRIDIRDIVNVYENIVKKSNEYIGIIIKYPNIIKEVTFDDRVKHLQLNKNKAKDTNNVNIGVIGAGLFGKALLLPSLKKINGVNYHTISTLSGTNAYHVAKKYSFNNITTDYKLILKNENINAVFILTPHSKHKDMVIESLKNGKHVFVEKPLCINENELEEINDIYNSLKEKTFLMVGYNRRFSPHSKRIFDFISKKDSPMMINYRVNAGFIPRNHWVHSKEEGGGRIIGEICHFLDLMIYFTNNKPIRIFGERISGDDINIVNNDNVNIVIKFQDGSVGNIFYSASGDKSFSREKVELYYDGKTAIITDFKLSEMYFNGKRKVYKTLNQELGYREEIQNFIDSILGRVKIALEYKEIYWSTLGIFKIIESLNTGLPAEF